MSNIEWTDQMESNFLASFIGKNCVYRPVGVHKHFAMMMAYNKFVKTLPPNTKITIEAMWAKLESLYDLDALEQDAVCPFPNDIQDFDLPPGWIPKPMEPTQQNEEEELERQRQEREREKKRKKESDEDTDTSAPKESIDSSSSSSSKSKRRTPSKKRVTRNRK